MEIILKQDVPNMGRIGDKVKVASGFARNYLIPKGLAMEASDKNVRVLQKAQELQEIRQNKKLLEAKSLAKRIRKISCTIVKQVSEGERLFGSVTPQDIVKGLEAEGIFLDKKQIVLEEPIKTLGIYPVKVQLTPDIESVLKVWVVK
ncbi:50S ribosomal protein L9 [bacterium]|nr:50S ribosomal protein L9 [candidate division CSSED10-310 bacterium]